MNKILAGYLRPLIEEIPEADKVAGYTQTIEKFDSQRGKVIKRFPASLDSNKKANQPESGYDDMTPNNQYKSIFFIEDLGIKTGPRHGNYIECESILRIVGWLNIEKLEATEAEIAVELINAIPEGTRNIGKLNSVQFKVAKILTPYDKMFSKYTFEEATRQYLMHPYSQIGIELNVNFRLNLSC